MHSAHFVKSLINISPSAINVPFNVFKTKLLSRLAENPFNPNNEFLTFKIVEWKKNRSQPISYVNTYFNYQFLAPNFTFNLVILQDNLYIRTLLLCTHGCNESMAIKYISYVLLESPWCVDTEKNLFSPKFLQPKDMSKKKKIQHTWRLYVDEQIKITTYLPAYHWFVVELLTLASIQEYSDCNRTFLEVTFCVNSSISASRSRQLAMSFTNSSLLVRRWVTSVCSWATLSFSLKVSYVFICSHTYSSTTLKSLSTQTFHKLKWQYQKCS